jgi:hypothetical protein
MLHQSFFSHANVHSATRTPIPSELLNNWQKCVGKKGAKSIVYTSPSPINDSDSDLPLAIAPLIKDTTRSSLAALPSADGYPVAGPSTIHQTQGNGTQETTSNRRIVDVFEIEGPSFRRCLAKLLNICVNSRFSFPNSTSHSIPNHRRN